MSTIKRPPISWQLILADLALILFLVTASALTNAREEDGEKEPVPDAGQSEEAFAASQALYRPGPGLPPFAQWLAAQPRDPRAAVTITAEYDGNGIREGEDRAWNRARTMATQARAMGIRTRVVIRQGQSETIWASLGYDQPAP